MAGKQKVVTLYFRYSEILASKGKDIRNYKILGFQFKGMFDVNMFFFALADAHYLYLLFDGATTIVKVIIEPINEKFVTGLATSCNGVSVTPNIY